MSVIIFVGVVIPTIAFTAPILAAFIVNLLHCVLLYGKRVRMPLGHIPGAALAAMSLQLTVARAVLVGMVRDSLPFRRTDKGGNAKRGSDNPALWETALKGRPVGHHPYGDQYDGRRRDDAVRLHAAGAKSTVPRRGINGRDRALSDANGDPPQAGCTVACVSSGQVGHELGAAHPGSAGGSVLC